MTPAAELRYAVRSHRFCRICFGILFGLIGAEISIRHTPSGDLGVFGVIASVFSGLTAYWATDRHPKDRT